MASKTFMRRVRSGRRAIDADMRAAGLDPTKAADRAEHSRRIYAGINERLDRQQKRPR